MNALHARSAAVLGALLACAARPAAASDFNGDGYDDLAIASRGVSGMTAPGKVHVLFGSGAGLSPLDEIPLVPAQFGISDNFADFGRALAAGDFDGDRFDDLAIGVPGATVSGHADAGLIVVVRGGPFGFDVANAKTFSQDTPGIAEDAEDPIITFGSPVEYPEEFGATLAAGDFDGDGRDDLAIGVSENLPGAIAAGGFHVLLGSAQGLGANKSRYFTQDSKDVPDDVEGFDRFGATLVAGDLNGDGKDDLCVTTPGETNPPPLPNGKLWVFFGGSGGIKAKRCRAFDPAQLGEEGDLLTVGTPLGHDYAIGNFDRSGRPELVVGMPGHASSEGELSVVTARKSSLALGTVRTWDQDHLGGNSSETGDFFGWDLATGDFDGDGYPDVAASAIGEDLAGLFDTGLVTVVHGGPDGLHEYGDSIEFGSNGVPGTLQQGSQAGTLLASGDFDGDGFADLAIAAPFYTVSVFGIGTTDYPASGAVVVVRGSPIGLIGVGGRFLSEPFGVVNQGQFGRALSR